MREQNRGGIYKAFSFIVVIVLLFSQTIYIFAGEESVAVDTSDHEGYIIMVKEDADVETDDPEIEKLSDDIYWVDSKSDAYDAVERSDIEHIEPNYKVELCDFPETDPDDPFYQISASDYQYNLHMVSANAIWQAGLRGEGVKIGIVDTGINSSHIDFSGSTILKGYNYSNYTLNGVSNRITTDEDGHGTFVSSVVNAVPNNGMAIAGMTDKVSLLPIKVMVTDEGLVSDTIKGIDKAIEEDCDVINVSIVAKNDSPAMRQVVQRATDSGAVIVAAVGNDGKKPLQRLYYPAANENVIGVGSVSKSGILSDFSQRNESVFVTAPGDDILGLSSYGNSAFDLMQGGGTSFSAPMVAAMAVSAKDVNDDITVGGIEYLLTKTAVDKGAAGWDSSYGHGMVDVRSYIDLLTSDYAITYELGGGTFNGGFAATYSAFNKGMTLPVNVSKAGMFFDGWYEASDFSSTRIKSIPSGSVGERTYYAKWVETPVENIFTDIKETDWFRDAVQYVYDAGLFMGTSADKFSPGMAMERGMFVTVIGRHDNVDTNLFTTSAFSDVQTGKYYAPYVSWASSNNIVQGFGNGIFAPTRAVTREQMALIAYDYSRYKGKDVSATTSLTSYRDYRMVSPWSDVAVRWAVAEGILNGKTGGYLDPRGTATRAEVSTLMMRLDHFLS